MTLRRVWPPASARPHWRREARVPRPARRAWRIRSRSEARGAFLAQTALSCCMMLTDLAADVELQPLWEPLQLREVTLANRVMCSATTLQYGHDGLLSDRHVA